MPDSQPSSAPTGTTPEPRDDLTAASLLRDDALERPAGGGGLGSGAALAGDGAGQSGAASPNSPIDVAVHHEGSDAQATAEARSQAVVNDAREPGHLSR